MRILINNKPEILEMETITLSELVNLKSIPENGTAIALNGRVVRKQNWESAIISDGDSITVISAAYGG